MFDLAAYSFHISQFLFGGVVLYVESNPTVY